MPEEKGVEQVRSPCSNCGCEVGPEDAFCSSCGARQAEAVGAGAGGSGVGRAGEALDTAIAGERRPEDLVGAHPSSRLHEEEQERRLFDRVVGLPPGEALPVVCCSWQEAVL